MIDFAHDSPRSGTRERHTWDRMVELMALSHATMSDDASVEWSAFLGAATMQLAASLPQTFTRGQCSRITSATAEFLASQFKLIIEGN